MWRGKFHSHGFDLHYGAPGGDERVVVFRHLRRPSGLTISVLSERRLPYCSLHIERLRAHADRHAGVGERPDPAAIRQAHGLHRSLTGQCLGLGYDHERVWFELLRAGYSLDDLRHLVAHLQCEIRAVRRNVGVFKLSNLLQRNRFEDDLAISRVALCPPPRPTPPSPSSFPSLPSEEPLRRRQERLRLLRELRHRLR